MRDDMEWLLDILDALRKIERYSSLGYDAFAEEELLQIWIIHYLEVIGEASNHISKRQLDDWVEITTPYLDRHNDYLQIYARRQNGSYILTDDGYILSKLELSGCKLESPKRLALLQMTLNEFGVKLIDGALEVLSEMRR